MKRYKIFLSRHRKKNHLTITLGAESENDMEMIVRNLKKTILKENRLVKGGVSYEIHCHIRKS